MPNSLISEGNHGKESTPRPADNWQQEFAGYTYIP